MGGNVSKALVTGGAGFIGSHVARHLLGDCLEVTVLDDLSGGFRENVPPEARLVEVSVTDYPALKSLFEAERFEYVFHLAAHASEGLSHFIRRHNYKTNLVGSINLINLSVLYETRCFVFTSSIAVYGENRLPMTEEFTPKPVDPYGISKYATELDLASAHRQFGLDYIIFRPHNVYGEHQNIGDKYRNVVGIFMRQILLDQPLTIFVDGEQMRAFSYIDDVAPVIARSVKESSAYSETFNLGGDKAHSVNELALAVCKQMGVRPEIRHLPPRNEVKHAYASHEKLAQYFHLPEPVGLQDGLSKMAQWVRRTGYRASSSSPVIELPEGLPKGW